MPSCHLLFFSCRPRKKRPSAVFPALLLLLLLLGGNLRAASPASAAPASWEVDAQSSSRIHPDSLEGSAVSPRYSLGVRGGFLLPQNDLRMTTGPSPQVSIGIHAERLIHGVHQIRPTAEFWYFREGHQYSSTPTQSQSIDTKLRALVFGTGYLYRIGGADKRLSAGAGLYLIRWSVDSNDTLTINSAGTVQQSGNSTWLRLGESFDGSYRLSHRLELQGRWIHSHYGYEHIPVNVAIFGAGWRL